MRKDVSVMLCLRIGYAAVASHTSRCANCHEVVGLSPESLKLFRDLAEPRALWCLHCAVQQLALIRREGPCLVVTKEQLDDIALYLAEHMPQLQDWEEDPWPIAGIGPVREVGMAKTGDVNDDPGVYRSVCCGVERTLRHNAKFPSCPGKAGGSSCARQQATWHLVRPIKRVDR